MAITPDGAGVVLEGDDAVGWMRFQGSLHHGDEVVRHLLPVDDQLSLEEPVP